MIKRYKKPTVLVTWAFAYLAIFMVPVVLLSYVLLRSTKVITNESIRANENFAEQISISLDKGLSDLSNVAQNCVRSYEVLQILESQEYGTAQFHYNAYIAIEYEGNETTGTSDGAAGLYLSWIGKSGQVIGKWRSGIGNGRDCKAFYHPRKSQISV